MPADDHKHNNGWGGKRAGGGWPRPGPGRPRKDDGEKPLQVNVKLSPALIERARALGDGNLSAGIRRALEQLETTD